MVCGGSCYSHVTNLCQSKYIKIRQPQSLMVDASQYLVANSLMHANCPSCHRLWYPPHECKCVCFSRLDLNYSLYYLKFCRHSRSFIKTDTQFYLTFFSFCLYSSISWVATRWKTIFIHVTYVVLFVRIFAEYH